MESVDADMEMLKRDFDQIFFAWERLGFANPNFPYAYTFDKLVKQNRWTNHYSHDKSMDTYDFDDIKSSYDAKSICKQVPSTREAHSWKTGGHHSRPPFPPRLDRSWIPPKSPWESCTPTSPCSSSPLRTPPTIVKSILALSTR